MLAGEQRGRHHHRHLFAAHCGHECRAKRHFGFAEADIAADEAIHRAALAKIGDGFGNRFFLILGFLIGETGAELIIDARRRIYCRKRTQFARRRNADQLARDLADALLHLGLAQLPARAAKAIQLRRAFIGAIARQQFDILDRQEQLAAIIL